MEWTRQIDGYCERLSPDYWAEPVNAVTNLAFLVAAAIMWRRTVGLPLGRILATILGAIGVGSYLFHTHATVWAAMTDVVPIGLFILVYLYAVLLHFWNLSVGWSLFGTALFLPYAAALIPLFNALPFFEISAGYWPVPLLVVIVALALRSRHIRTANGLLMGAALLCLSLVLRSADLSFCASVPLGTHFLWHLLNGLMLGWMIEVYRRHMLAGTGPER